MDKLLNAMQIIDRNSDKFAEGEYLELCNLLKEAYDKRADPVYFFNYDDFRILPIGGDSSNLTFQYFYDHYFEKALQFDSDFIQGQLNYLQKEYENAGPIRRHGDFSVILSPRTLREACALGESPNSKPAASSIASI